jgi:hypothetical protein
MLRLGLDLDGVVADFRTAFRLLAERELDRPAELAETELSRQDVDRLWKVIDQAPNWWLDLPAYEPDQIARLYELSRRGRWEVFFLTSRPPSAGDSVQLQTQVWLERQGFYLPSVLTTPAGARGELARALRLDVAVDDRIVNCIEIISASTAKAVLLARGARDPAFQEVAEARGVAVTTTFAESLDAVQRLEALLPTRRGRLGRLSDWFSPKPHDPVLPHDPREERRGATRPSE